MTRNGAPNANLIRICIEELQVNAYLGVHPSEQKEQRSIPVDLEFEYECPQSDSLTEAVDYREVRNKIFAAVEGRRFRLIETMAKTILDAIRQDPRVVHVVVKVRKTKALKQAKAVAAVLEWFRTQR